MKSTSIKCRLFVHSIEGVILDHFFVPVFLHILIWWDPCDPSLWSLEDVSPQHRHDILCKPQFCRFFLLFFKFNSILPNVVFKFLSLTFSFHSSCCFNFSLVLPWLISLPTYFCYLPFTLFCIKIQFVISLVIFHIKRTSFRITSFIQFLIRHANCTKSEVYH